MEVQARRHPWHRSAVWYIAGLLAVSLSALAIMLVTNGGHHLLATSASVRTMLLNPWLETPLSQCGVRAAGMDWREAARREESGLPFLFDTATMPGVNETCRHCDGSEVAHIVCCGVCQFENRQCDRFYPGQNKSEAIMQHADEQGMDLASFSPCELFQRIRGRTLVFMGDSQTWHFYYSAECFLREFAVDAGLRRSTPARDAETAAALMRVTKPVRASPICLDLMHDTRVCAIRVDTAQDMIKHTLPTLRTLSSDISRDIVVFNTGLHYRSVPHFKWDVGEMAKWRKATPRSERPAMVWMDVPVQHFRGPTGQYNHNNPVMDCHPLKAWYDGDPNVVRGGPRNMAIAPLIPALADARLATYNASVPLWDSHKKGECTHWCSPGAYHLWLYLLNDVLDASSIGNALPPPKPR